MLETITLRTMSSRKTTCSNGRVKIAPRCSRSKGSKKRRQNSDEPSVAYNDNGSMGIVAYALEDAMRAAADGVAANHKWARQSAGKRWSKALSNILRNDPALYSRMRKALDKERLQNRRSHHRSVGNHDELHDVICDGTSISASVQIVGGQRAKNIRRREMSGVEDKTVGHELKTHDRSVESLLEYDDSTPRAIHSASVDMTYEVAPGWEDVLYPAPPPRRLSIYQELGTETSSLVTRVTAGGPFELGYPDPSEAARAQILGNDLSWEQVEEVPIPPSHMVPGYVEPALVGTGIWKHKAVQRQLDKQKREETNASISHGEDLAVDLEESIFEK